MFFIVQKKQKHHTQITLCIAVLLPLPLFNLFQFLWLFLVKIDKKQKIWWFAFVKNVIIIFVKRFRKKEEISMHKYGPVIKMLSLVTQIGITMLTSVFLCMAIGMWIDKHFSTNLFLLFLILGIMASIRSMFITLKPLLKGEREKKDEAFKKQLDEQFKDSE